MSRFEFPMADVKICDQAKSYVNDCLNRNWISTGLYSERCRVAISNILKKEAILCSSGTAGLHSVLSCLNLPKGAKVLVPNCTFGATANAVLLAGFEPVFIDVDLSTGCVSKEALTTVNDPDIHALVYVHLYGVPGNDFLDIVALCEEKGWLLIEDAAEAFGAKLNGQYLGTFGVAGVFSFYANKTISSGEGGCVVGDRLIVDKVGHFISHGMSKKHRYYHTRLGTNYRITDMQSALILPQLDALHQILSKREAVFRDVVSRLECFKKHLAVINKTQLSNVEPSFWLLALRLKNMSRRQVLTMRLAFHKNGIETRPVFPPLHCQPAFRKYRMLGDNSASVELFKKGLCLPVLPTLIDEAKLNTYSEKILSIMSQFSD